MAAWQTDPPHRVGRLAQGATRVKQMAAPVTRPMPYVELRFVILNCRLS